MTCLAGEFDSSEEQFTNHIGVRSFIVCLFSDQVISCIKLICDVKNCRFIAKQRPPNPRVCSIMVTFSDFSKPIGSKFIFGA